VNKRVKTGSRRKAKSGFSPKEDQTMHHAISGIYEAGRVVLKTPVDWLEGTSVEVTLVQPASNKIGMTEDDWRTDPESIAKWLKWYDSLEPLEFTPQEEADQAAWRQKVKEYDIAKSQRRIEIGLIATEDVEVEKCLL
jgi:hypothetical protein